MYDIESLVRNEIGNFNRKLMAPQPLSPGLPQGFADGGQVGSGYPVAGAGFPKAGTDPSTGRPWPTAGANFPTAGADFPKAGLPQPQPTPQQGYAVGGAIKAPGIQPPPPINEGGDNTMIAAKTGEYILPDKVAALPAEDIAAKINYVMAKNPNMTAKELFDEITFMTTGTPPNNAGAPAPGAPPPSVRIKPQGFAVGGEVQNTLMGQDVPPTPSLGLSPAPKAETPEPSMSSPAQPKMGLSAASAPSAPSLGLKPANSGAPAPGAPPLKTVGIQAIGTPKDPLAKTFTGSGMVKNQPMNSADVAGDLQHQREAFGQQGQTAPQPQVMVGNPHGISSNMNEADAFQKGLMTPEQRKDYQDRQVQQQELGIKAKSLDNEAAYRNAALGIKQQEANTKDKSADSLAGYRKTMQDAKKNMGKGVMSSLDPQTRKDLALQYAKTGKLPPLGMGASAAADREAILTEWSQAMHGSGGSVEDQIMKQSALKASQSELTKLQGQRGTIMAFAKTADSNLELVSKLSDQVGRSGSPILNKWLLAGSRSVAGDPEVAKFDAAVRTAINEYAKVTSSASGGGVTSDSARKEVESMLNSAQTPEQVKQVIGLLRQEINNRQKGYDDQIEQIRSAIIGQPAGAPGIQPGAAPGQGDRASSNGVDRLTELARKDFNKGYTVEQIVHGLLDRGASQDDIRNAVKAAKGA